MNSYCNFLSGKFVIALTYYGLSLNSGNMPGSLYVNATFSALAALTGNFLCFLASVLGRKRLHVISMLVGGLACIVSIAVYYAMKGRTYSTCDEKMGYK